MTVYGAAGCPTPAKAGYEKRATAKKIMRGLHKKGKRAAEGQVLSVYLCDCGYFHIGNIQRGRSREEVREVRAAYYQKDVGA